MPLLQTIKSLVSHFRTEDRNLDSSDPTLIQSGNTTPFPRAQQWSSEPLSGTQTVNASNLPPPVDNAGADSSHPTPFVTGKKIH